MRNIYSSIDIGTDTIKLLTVEAFHDKGYVLAFNENDELSDLIKLSKKMKVQKYQTNNQKMIELITDFIDNN